MSMSALAKSYAAPKHLHMLTFYGLSTGTSVLNEDRDS